MKILINYDSSWRNSFLDGDNNVALPKKGRKFIASMTNLKTSKNFIRREITLNTVMGVINRLIGDQRKLYHSRSTSDYYFRDIEKLVTFMDNPELTNEMTYIRNISGSTDQNSFTGMIKTDDVIFQSDYSQELWGVLALDTDELYSFILDDTKVDKLIKLDPIVICEKFDELRKIKSIIVQGKAKKVIQYLDTQFNDTNYVNNKGEIVIENVYCSAIYLQLNRLSESFDISTAITKTGVISGISKRLFTKKDFMDRFTTGEKKKIYGNPYIRKERIKGEGEVVSMLTKASGTLEIYIDINREDATEIKTMIENAGVSSFPLGKKGLAYVSNIDTRPRRN